MLKDDSNAKNANDANNGYVATGKNRKIKSSCACCMQQCTRWWRLQLSISQAF